MTALLWLAFVVVIIVMLALDLGVFHKGDDVQTPSQAVLWTTLWVALALLFNGAVYYLYEHHALGIGLDFGHELTGGEAALQFFTGYLIEKSLSLDNVFVIALVFAYFGVPAKFQHRVLFYGVLGAIVMRGVMILAGSALITRFEWMTYVFGALLIATAVKMLIARHDNLEPGRNPLVRIARKLYPVSAGFEGRRFFTTLDGRRAITPLFLVLIVVESTDLLFAVDSIPAIFAVTRDPFLIFTSNVFAILGLRSLYFVLTGVMERFQYLKISLVFVLAFVGIKMLLAHHHPIPAVVSLSMIAGILAVGVVASLLASHHDTAALVSPLVDELEEAAELTWKHARRVIIALSGATVLVVGLAMIVLPGPAVIVVPAGLAILGTEFIWARKLLSTLRARSKEIAGSLRGASPSGPSRSDSTSESQ